MLYKDIQNGKARVPGALVAEVHTKMVASIDTELTTWNETRAHLEATVVGDRAEVSPPGRGRGTEQDLRRGEESVAT